MRYPLIQILDEPDAATPDAVGRIIDATRPTEVRVDEISCGPVKTSTDDLRYQMHRLEPRFAVANDGNALSVRIEHLVQFASGAVVDDPETTDIRVVHLANFAILDELETTVQAISVWIETNVYFIVYPYLRQILTVLTGELGLPPLVLDYMHRDEAPYSDTRSAESAAIE